MAPSKPIFSPEGHQAANFGGLSWCLNHQTESISSVSVADVLRALAGDPAGLLVRRWNWKSALLSSLFRAAIFFAANWTAGWRAAVAAMSVEFLYRGISAGIFGALTQAFREAQLVWLAACTAMVTRCGGTS